MGFCLEFLWKWWGWASTRTMHVYDVSLWKLSFPKLWVWALTRRLVFSKNEYCILEHQLIFSFLMLKFWGILECNYDNVYVTVFFFFFSFQLFFFFIIYLFLNFRKTWRTSSRRGLVVTVNQWVAERRKDNRRQEDRVRTRKQSNNYWENSTLIRNTLKCYSKTQVVTLKPVLYFHYMGKYRWYRIFKKNSLLLPIMCSVSQKHKNCVSIHTAEFFCNVACKNWSIYVN